MGTDNIIFLENLEWFDNTGKELVHRLPQKGSGGQGKPGRCIFLSRKGPGCIWAGPAYTQNRQHSNFDKNPQLALGTHQPP